MQVQSLSWEDPLKEDMAIDSSILAWKIPWTEEPGGLQSMGSQRVWHDWVTELNGNQNQAGDGFPVMVSSFPSLFHPLPPVFFHSLQVCGPYASTSISPLQLPPSFFYSLSIPLFLPSVVLHSWHFQPKHTSVHKLDFIIELISLSL